MTAEYYEKSESFVLADAEKVKEIQTTIVEAELEEMTRYKGPNYQILERGEALEHFALFERILAAHFAENHIAHGKGILNDETI